MQSTRCRRKALPSSYCRLDTEGGVSCCSTDCQLTTCRMKARLQPRWLEYSRISYLMYRIYKTRSSTTHRRTKKSEYFQQTQILYSCAILAVTWLPLRAPLACPQPTLSGELAFMVTDRNSVHCLPLQKQKACTTSHDYLAWLQHNLQNTNI